MSGTDSEQFRLVAFANSQCIASGAPETVIPQIKSFSSQFPEQILLVLDAVSSRPVDLDLRGSIDSILTRFSRSHPSQISTNARLVKTKRSRGRPKLGVVSREVTLLPRHWEWLSSQPGGASVALRKLVEEARRASEDSDGKRAAQESAYRFMTVMAGNEKDYEEAIRALYANDMEKLSDIVRFWPQDVGEHSLVLARSAVGVQEN